MAADVALTGTQKAAVLLITLGSDASAQVLPFLQEEELERVTLEIFNMQAVPQSVRRNVLEESYHLSLTNESVDQGGYEYARMLLTRTLGDKRAKDLIARVQNMQKGNPFDFVRDADAVQLAGFLQDEHPQTIALVLSHLPPAQAGSVLSSLSPDYQAEVAERIAVMDSTDPEVVSEVEQGLQRKLSSLVTHDYSLSGGVEYVVNVLNQVDRGTEKSILDALDETNPTLAEEIRQKMFVFENIVMLDDRSVQRMLREVDTKDLVLALKGASEQAKDLIFRNMSTRAADLLREDVSLSGPVRLRNVEEAQQRIVGVIRRLEAAEEIVISRGGDDELIV